MKLRLSKLDKAKARKIRRHKGRGPIAPRPGVAFVDQKKQQDKYACRGKYVLNCF